MVSTATLLHPQWSLRLRTKEALSIKEQVALVTGQAEAGPLEVAVRDVVAKLRIPCQPEYRGAGLHLLWCKRGV